MNRLSRLEKAVLKALSPDMTEGDIAGRLKGMGFTEVTAKGVRNAIRRIESKMRT